jgi:uncharacterized protein (TIGR02452 family)
MDRFKAEVLARETLRILNSGEYGLGGHVVTIWNSLDMAKRGTRVYDPGVPVTFPERAWETQFLVTRETTLGAARRIVASGLRPVALNFASATNPGGGFIRGALAQEESLARSSGLFTCIQDSPMHAHHRALMNPMYTDYCIYSPWVPVFRDDEGQLIPPYSCAFMTCAAVNAGAVLESSPALAGQIRVAMASRVRRVLAVAASHGHEDVILGAWGCGVFRNDPGAVSGLFKEAFETEFKGAFKRVVFAIPDGRNAGPFERDFGS